jgi:hypothetical protein
MTSKKPEITREDLIEMAENSKVLDLSNELLGFGDDFPFDEFLIQASRIRIITLFEKDGDIYRNARISTVSGSESGLVYLRYPDIDYWVFLLPRISFDYSEGRTIGYALFSDGTRVEGLYSVKKRKGDSHIEFVIYDATDNNVKGVHRGLDREAYEQLQDEVFEGHVINKLFLFWRREEPFLTSEKQCEPIDYRKFIEENAEDRVYEAFLKKLKRKER